MAYTLDRDQLVLVAVPVTMSRVSEFNVLDVVPLGSWEVVYLTQQE